MTKLNMYNNHPKRVKKNDLLMMCGFASVLQFFGAFLNNYQTMAVIIALIAIAFIIIFYFAKTTKKVLTENNIRLNIGIVGLFGSVACNILIAIYRENAILKIMATFAIMTVAALIISTLLALLTNKLSKKSKNKNINITPFAFAGALFGIALSKYCNSKGIELPIDILIYVLNLVFTFITIINLFKLKQSEKKSDIEN